MTTTTTALPIRWHVVPQGTVVSLTSTTSAKAAREAAARQSRKCRVLTSAQLALSIFGTLPYAD